MSSAEEIMMPMAHGEAMQQANLHIMRQITNDLEKQGRALEKISDNMADMRERMARIEASGIGSIVANNTSRIEKLEREVDALQLLNSRAEGVKGFLAQCVKVAPWLFGILGAAGIIVGIDGIVG